MVEEVVHKLIERKETIGTMEGCTGGAIANAITNVQGSSNVINFAAVTYSHEYKARLGVDRKLIEEYSVYSFHVARDMAFKITFFSECTYGIGITGRFNTIPMRVPGKRRPKNKVFVSIYNSKTNSYTDFLLDCPNKKRDKCKEFIIEKVMEKLLEIMADNK